MHACELLYNFYCTFYCTIYIAEFEIDPNKIVHMQLIYHIELPFLGIYIRIILTFQVVWRKLEEASQARH
jgi:hypothetical protein